MVIRKYFSRHMLVSYFVLLSIVPTLIQELKFLREIIPEVNPGHCVRAVTHKQTSQQTKDEKSGK